MKIFDYYIFDLDNTLIDSRAGYEEAFMAGFSEFGMPYEPALYSEYIRTPLSITFSNHYPNSPGMFKDFFSVVMSTYNKTCLNGIRLFPDAERCLNILSKKGCRFGIVSNSFMSEIEPILRTLNVNELFSSVVGKDRVVIAKPDPEPVLLCMKEMGASPHNSLMVGDSVNDILAGKGAGVFSVLIDREDQDIRCDECDMRIKSLIELCDL
jgi:phosphoglycolate phosphatase-like HAD superfamily hydrolase